MKSAQQSGIIPKGKRLAQRASYGDIRSVHDSAIAELQCGNFKNAWALLQESLGQSLRLVWISMPGRQNSGVTDKATLAHKLYNLNRLDKWTYGLLTQAIHHPHGFDRRRVELLASIVDVLVRDTAGLRPSEEPTRSAIKAQRKLERTEESESSSQEGVVAA